MRLRKATIVLGAIVGTCVVAVIALTAFDSRVARRKQDALARIERPEMLNIMESMRSATGGSSVEPEVAAVRRSLDTFQDLFDAAAHTEDDPAWNELLDWISKPEAEWEGGVWERLRAHMAAVGPVLDRIRTAAATGGPVRAIALNDSHDDLEPFRQIRHYARLLHADGAVAIHDGETSRAIDNIVAMIDLGNALFVEPTLISQLCGYPMFMFADDSLASLPSTGLESADYLRLQQALSGASDREHFAACFPVEALAAERFFAGPSLDIGLSWSQSAVDRIFAEVVYESPVGAPFRRWDEATFLDVMVELHNLARMPYHDSAVSLQALVQRHERASWARPYTSTVLTSLTTAFLVQARHEAFLSLAQVGLAIEQYRNERGELPPDLNTVSPWLPNGTVPRDPFSRLDFGYRPSEDSFVLYSIGEDMIDENGRVGPTHAVGDLVWRGSPQS